MDSPDTPKPAANPIMCSGYWPPDNPVVHINNSTTDILFPIAVPKPLRRIPALAACMDACELMSKAKELFTTGTPDEKAVIGEWLVLVSPNNSVDGGDQAKFPDLDWSAILDESWRLDPKPSASLCGTFRTSAGEIHCNSQTAEVLPSESQPPAPATPCSETLDEWQKDYPKALENLLRLSPSASPNRKVMLQVGTAENIDPQANRDRPSSP